MSSGNDHNNSEYTPFVDKIPVQKIFIAIFSALFIIACFDEWKRIQHEHFAKDQWETLMDKGYAHQTLVTTYRDCRKSTSKMVEECLIITNDYAKSVGLRDESVWVIRDIKLTSDTIKAGHFFTQRKVH